MEFLSCFQSPGDNNQQAAQRFKLNFRANKGVRGQGRGDVPLLPLFFHLFFEPSNFLKKKFKPLPLLLRLNLLLSLTIPVPRVWSHRRRLRSLLSAGCSGITTSRPRSSETISNQPASPSGGNPRSANMHTALLASCPTHLPTEAELEFTGIVCFLYLQVDLNGEKQQILRANRSRKKERIFSRFRTHRSKDIFLPRKRITVLSLVQAITVLSLVQAFIFSSVSSSANSYRFRIIEINQCRLVCATTPFRNQRSFKGDWALFSNGL